MELNETTIKHKYKIGDKVELGWDSVPYIIIEAIGAYWDKDGVFHTKYRGTFTWCDESDIIGFYAKPTSKNEIPYYIIGTDIPNREYWYIPSLGQFVKEEDDISLDYKDERETTDGRDIETAITAAKQIGLYEITVIYHNGSKLKIDLKEQQ